MGREKAAVWRVEMERRMYEEPMAEGRRFWFRRGEVW